MEEFAVACMVDKDNGAGRGRLRSDRDAGSIDRGVAEGIEDVTAGVVFADRGDEADRGADFSEGKAGVGTVTAGMGLDGIYECRGAPRRVGGRNNHGIVYDGPGD
jgi:hypothetical protein